MAYLINNLTGRAIDSNENKFSVFANNQKGLSYQKWNLINRGDYYHIINLTSGLVFDSNEKGEVYVLPLNDGNYQKWKMVMGNDKKYCTFQDVQTKRYLDNKESNIMTTNSNDGSEASLRWTIESFEEVVENPSWEYPIKGYFENKYGCMRFKFDLQKYNDVKDNSMNILERLNPHKGCDGRYIVPIMPMSNGWPSEHTAEGEINVGGYRETRVTNFRRWMEQGHKEKWVKPKTPIIPKVIETRIRKNAKDLSTGDVELLAKAFRGIKNLPPDNPNSFFFLASIHATPRTYTWCRHHDFSFLPWHRWYSILMENALRSIPGCEKVTLPYWYQAEEIKDEKTDGPPEWLWKEPFNGFDYQQYFKNNKEYFDKLKDEKETDYKFSLNIDEGVNLERGTSQFPTTVRLSRELTLKQLKNYYKKGYSISDLFAKARKSFFYESFADWNYVDCTGDQKENSGIEHPHDNIHHLLGDLVPGKLYPDLTDLGDMLFQEYTAFDPIFWFSHCDFDRNLWDWQKKWKATDELGIFRTFKRFQKGPSYLHDKLLFNLEYKKNEKSEYDSYFKTFADLINLNCVDVATPTLNDRQPKPKIASIQYEEPKPKFEIEHNLKNPRLLLSNEFENSSKRPSGNKVSINDFSLQEYRGSVIIKLFSGNTLIDEKFVFLAIDQKTCKSCQERPLSNFVFSSPHTSSEYSIKVFSALTGEDITKQNLENNIKKISVSSTFHSN